MFFSEPHCYRTQDGQINQYNVDTMSLSYGQSSDNGCMFNFTLVIESCDRVVMDRKFCKAPGWQLTTIKARLHVRHAQHSTTVDHLEKKVMWEQCYSRCPNLLPAGHHHCNDQHWQHLLILPALRCNHVLPRLCRHFSLVLIICDQGFSVIWRPWLLLVRKVKEDTTRFQWNYLTGSHHQQLHFQKSRIWLTLLRFI